MYKCLAENDVTGTKTSSSFVELLVQGQCVQGGRVCLLWATVCVRVHVYMYLLYNTQREICV